MTHLAKSAQAFAIAFVLLGSMNQSAAGQRYRIELIGQVPTTDPYQFVERVAGLNNLGEVAFSYNHTIYSGTPWRNVNTSYVSTRTGIATIPNLGGEDIQAADLTDNGLVVGGSASADTYQTRLGESHYYEPFVSLGGNTIAIPVPKRGFASAIAANERGEVVGHAWSSASGSTVFKWSESDGYQDLGNFAAYTAYPVDINESSDFLMNVTPDEILQFGGTYSYRGTEAIIYKDGVITKVPDSQFKITNASAINDLGVVVGAFATIPGVESHAYVWDERKGFRDLGREGEHSGSTDINNAGVVIGAYGDAYQAPTTPFVYTEAAGRQTLFDLIDNHDGWIRLDSASHINDRGQIAGIGEHSTWGRRVYLVTPIPEPSTMTACLLCSVCLVAASRRRVRR